MGDVSVGEVALVIAVAVFVVLSVILIRVLLTLKETLIKTTDLIDGLTLTNRDVRNKIGALTPWFQMTNELGTNLARRAEKNGVWQNHRVTYSSSNKATAVVADVLECALAAYRVWDQTQSRR